MARVWNPPNGDDLVRRYVAGASANKLAGECGVSQQTFAHLLRRRGISVRGRGTQPATPAMIDAYASGESVLAMSKRLGISRPSVTNRLRTAGVVLRGVQDNGRNGVAAYSRAALTKELRGSVTGPYEQVIFDWLDALDLNPIAQRAVGPYNIDIAVLPVAVEVLGSDWHNSPPKLTAMRKRTEYLLGCGWDVVYVVLSGSAPLPGVASEIQAHVEISRRNPSASRGYRVLGRDGQPSAAFHLDLD